MTKIIDRNGKGADINATENDANLSSLSGINAPIVATSHTIDVDDQNDTIEYSNASSIAVTLPAISTVSGAFIHTDDFKVTLKNIGAGVVTVTRGGTDTFDDGSTSLALDQYEYVTIQTDNSLTKWNIINGNHTITDYATKTGTETLTNKTLTEPVIQINSTTIEQVIQHVTATSAVEINANTGSIPVDDTIPTATEGDELLTATITPLSASSNLEITIEFTAYNGNATATLAWTIVDKTGAVTKAAFLSSNSTNRSRTYHGVVTLPSPGTSANVYSLRAGVTAGDYEVNGDGARLFGGVLSTKINIKEIL